jgi:hypothetical protein
MSSAEDFQARRIGELAGEIRDLKRLMSDALMNVPVGAYILITNADPVPTGYALAGPSGPTGYRYVQRQA